MALIMANGLTTIQVWKYLEEHILSYEFEQAIERDVSLWARMWRGVLVKRSDEFYWRLKR